MDSGTQRGLHIDITEFDAPERQLRGLLSRLLRLLRRTPPPSPHRGCSEKL